LSDVDQFGRQMGRQHDDDFGWFLLLRLSE
jgi:hypothetical protein